MDKSTNNFAERLLAQEDARLLGCGFLRILPNGAERRLDPRSVRLGPEEAHQEDLDRARDLPEKMTWLDEESRLTPEHWNFLLPKSDGVIKPGHVCEVPRYKSVDHYVRCLVEGRKPDPRKGD